MIIQLQKVLSLYFIMLSAFPSPNVIAPSVSTLPPSTPPSPPSSPSLSISPRFQLSVPRTTSLADPLTRQFQESAPPVPSPNITSRSAYIPISRSPCIASLLLLSLMMMIAYLHISTLIKLSCNDQCHDQSISWPCLVITYQETELLIVRE